MTANEAIESLQKILDDHDYNNEMDHIKADEVLLQFIETVGYPQVAHKYHEVREKIGFWYA